MPQVSLFKNQKRLIWIGAVVFAVLVLAYFMSRKPYTIETYKLAKYVDLDSDASIKLVSRIEGLYSGACSLPFGSIIDTPYVINGERVSLAVPRDNAYACRQMIPVAICDVAPGEDPFEVCIRTNF